MSKSYGYEQYIRRLEDHGSRVALVDGTTDEELTYGQLTDLSRRAAGLLRASGLKPGERVLIIGVKGLDWVPIFFGTQLASIVAVPLDTRASSALVEAVIESTRPVLIIKGGKVKFKSAIKTVTPESFLGKARGLKEVNRSPEPRPESLGQILLSSGTWSQPKGVTLKQGNVLQNMLAACQVYSLGKREVLLSILPLSHAYEQMCGLHIPLRAGCKVVYLDEIQAEKIKAMIKKYGVTLIVAVPRILELFQGGILGKLPEAKRPGVIKLSHRLRFLPVGLRRLVFKKVHQGLGPSLRTLTVGGAPLLEETDGFFQGLGYKVLIGYGLSETSPIVSISTRQLGRRVGDVGRILDNIEAKVNDEGELLVRGPSVFAGYWPKVRHWRAWFNTGDLAELRGRDLRLVGRRKDMIVFAGGDKVMSADIEAVIAGNLADIEEVIIMPAEGRGGLSKGLLVAYRAASEQDKAIERLLAEHLPRSIRLLGARNIHPEYLSRTHTLKLARKKNQERFARLFAD